LVLTVPGPVTEAAKAAIGWRRIDAELAELLSDSAVDAELLAGVRGAGTRARSVSFGAGELTIQLGQNRVRTEGWRQISLGGAGCLHPRLAGGRSRRAGDVVTLDVRDDGVGFASELSSGVPSEHGGFGLTAMRQRVLALGGNLEIETELGCGTTVCASIPAIPIVAQRSSSLAGWSRTLF
jgi:hypothetical protein